MTERERQQNDSRRLGFTVFADGAAVEVASVEAWHMGSIWVSKEQVLNVVE